MNHLQKSILKDIIKKNKNMNKNMEYSFVIIELINQINKKIIKNKINLNLKKYLIIEKMFCRFFQNKKIK